MLAIYHPNFTLVWLSHYALLPLTCRDEVHILADGVKQQPLKADWRTQTTEMWQLLTHLIQTDYVCVVYKFPRTSRQRETVYSPPAVSYFLLFLSLWWQTIKTWCNLIQQVYLHVFNLHLCQNNPNSSIVEMRLINTLMRCQSNALRITRL